LRKPSFTTDEFLRRLANPFWFQSFGAVMGMDSRFSGIATSVIGALNACAKMLIYIIENKLISS
jgi:hypothetical protein